VVDDDPMSQLCGHSITYRIAVGPQAGRKVFTLQTLPASDEPFDDAEKTQSRKPPEDEEVYSMTSILLPF